MELKKQHSTRVSDDRSPITVGCRCFRSPNGAKKDGNILTSFFLMHYGFFNFFLKKTGFSEWLVILKVLKILMTCPHSQLPG